MILQRGHRSGFTLLEVLLASTIGVLLLGALYFALDMVLRQSSAGREEVQKNDLTRAVLNRMQIDLAGALGPLPPRSGGEVTDDSMMMETTPTTEATDPNAATDPNVATTESPLTSGVDLPLGCGVVGNGKTLTVFVAKVPQSLTDRTADPNALLPTDLRRVTYYMGSSGGLCRQEKPWVTADGVRNNADADRTDEQGDLVSEDISDVSFEYYDGVNWLSEWDGSQTNMDGKSVMGPPRAIRVTLQIERVDSQGQTSTQKVRHVLPIRAANGLIPVPLPTETTEGM